MIKEKVGLEELLTGLAEECCELGQACLKLRRAYYGMNPTPVSREVAYDHFCEEIADVQLYLKQISYNHKYVTEIMEQKEKRWEERLKNAEMGKKSG